MKKSFLILPVLIFSALPVSSFAACKKVEDKNLSEYDITAEYDEDKRELKTSCVFTYYNSTQNEIETLPFNLWGNAYRQGAKFSAITKTEAAGMSSSDYGCLTVNNVEGCESWEVGGEDENILYVTPQEPVYPEQTTTITLDYTVKLANVNQRTGVTEGGCVNLGNCFALLCAYDETEGFIEEPYYSYGDPFVSECADFKVSLTAPAEYVAAASGKEVNREQSDGKVTLFYELDLARDFAIVLSKDFKTMEKDVNGITATAYYCGDEAPETAFNAACESLEYFSSAFGEYDYTTYSVAFTSLSVNGMEYPALVMIDEDLEEADGAYTAVHETAHQWWYAAVGSDQINLAFQDEGLAEYSALCFFENNPAYGFTRTALLGTAIKSYRGYFSVYSQLFGDADTSMEKRLDSFAGEYEYVNIAYNKGLLLFESLRAAMGDKKFFTALKNYYSEANGKIATREDLVAAFAALYDCEGVFDSYITGKVVI